MLTSCVNPVSHETYCIVKVILYQWVDEKLHGSYEMLEFALSLFIR